MRGGLRLVLGVDFAVDFVDAGLYFGAFCPNVFRFKDKVVDFLILNLFGKVFIANGFFGLLFKGSDAQFEFV